VSEADEPVDGEAREPEPGGPPPPDAFPAGVSVVLLAAGFVATRMFQRVALDRPAVAWGGVFAVVAGAALGLVAAQRVVWSSPLPLALRALRSLLLAPMTVFVAAAMLGEPSRRLQSVTIVGTALTLLVACGVGVVRALSTKGQRINAVPLALLLVGELCELFGPPMRLAFPTSSAAARGLDRFGAFAEALAFAGVAVAVLAALVGAVRRVGFAKVVPFLALPAALTLVTGTLPINLPRSTALIAQQAFGARFDLVGGAVVAHPSRLAVAAYTLLFSGLVTAAMVSLSTQRVDRGAGLRRALGWIAVLLAGFGAPTAAGSIDALRVVALTLGVLLLEDATARG
jgi:hypothetical protein